MSTPSIPVAAATAAVIYAIVAGVFGLLAIGCLITGEFGPAAMMIIVTAGLVGLADGIRRGFRGARVVGVAFGVLMAVGGVQAIGFGDGATGDSFALLGFATAVVGGAAALLLVVPASNREWFRRR